MMIYWLWMIANCLLSKLEKYRLFFTQIKTKSFHVCPIVRMIWYTMIEILKWNHFSICDNYHAALSVVLNLFTLTLSQT